jgi:hypothetical protein
MWFAPAMTATTASPLLGAWEQVGMLHPTQGKPVPWPPGSPNASVREFFCFFEDGTFRFYRFLKSAQVKSFDVAKRELVYDGHLDKLLDGKWRHEGDQLIQGYANRQGQLVDQAVKLGSVTPQQFVIEEPTPIPGFTLRIVYARFPR